MISHSFNVKVSLAHLFIVVPLVNVLVLVPISLGGLGIQEGAYTYFLMKMGLSMQEGFAIALILRVLITLACLPGGLFYALEGFSIKRLKRIGPY